MSQNSKVLVVMGSAADEGCAEKCLQFLKKMEIPFTMSVASAHRTPERLKDLLTTHEQAQVIIAFAGHAAHLAGVIASKTTRPVIGVPVPSSDLDGLDSLLATVQMPGGIPVATMAVGSAGSQNAAVFALHILALQDGSLQEKLIQYRKEMADKVIASSAPLEKKWNQ